MSSKKKNKEINMNINNGRNLLNMLISWDRLYSVNNNNNDEKKNIVNTNIVIHKENWIKN